MPVELRQSAALSAVTSPHSHRPDTLRSIYYALGANIAITVIKFAGATFTGSGALLAEGVHSLADSGNEALLLLGRKQAREPASAHHPLGHGRATYFWSFIVALLLFSAGGLVSIAEGYYKLQHLEPIEAPWVAVAIALFAMGAESISLRVTLRQIAKVRGDLSLYRWFRETRRSELIVVLGEDLAAIAGLSAALIALLATIATGNALYDALGTICIGVLLVAVASGLTIEIKSLLIGESAAPKTRRAIRAFLDAQPQIIEIHDLVTMQQGEELMIAVQARLDASLTAERMLRAIADCKTALQDEFPQAAWVFFEPVDDNEGRPAARQPRPRRRTRRAATSRA